MPSVDHSSLLIRLHRTWSHFWKQRSLNSPKSCLARLRNILLPHKIMWDDPARFGTYLFFVKRSQWTHGIWISFNHRRII